MIVHAIELFEYITGRIIYVATVLFEVLKKKAGQGEIEIMGGKKRCECGDRHCDEVAWHKLFFGDSLDVGVYFGPDQVNYCVDISDRQHHYLHFMHEDFVKLMKWFKSGRLHDFSTILNQPCTGKSLPENFVYVRWDASRNMYKLRNNEKTLRLTQDDVDELIDIYDIIPKEIHKHLREECFC